MSLESFRESAGVVDRSDRGKMVFKGEQAHWFLDQLVTNQVEGLEPGQGVDALLLTPKGRITSAMRLLSTGNSVHADFEPGQVDALREFFEGRIFTTKVEIIDRTNDFGILSVLGPRADEFAAVALERFVAGETEEDRALGAGLPGEEEHHTVHFGSVAAVRLVRPVRGVDLFVRTESLTQLSQLLQEAGGEPASEDHYAALCSIEGIPRFGMDFDDGYLPQEAALERMVHFDKGCYLGQESVAMAQRGQVKRRLRHLAFDGEPATGKLVLDGNEVGVVTSAASEGGRGFGIGTVKTSVELGAELELISEERATSRARVLEIPGTTQGPQVPSARELRERLQRG